MEIDNEWYLKTYKDVRNSGESASSHFKKYGYFEGRYPNFNSIPFELLPNGEIANQLKVLKNQIIDSELDDIDSDSLFSGSRFQLKPEFLIKNPLFEIYNVLENKLERNKIRVIIFKNNKLNKFIKNIFKRLIIIIILEKNKVDSKINQIFIEHDKSIFKYNIQYPYNESETFLYQFLNFLFYWKSKRRHNTWTPYIINLTGQFSLTFKSFRKIFKH